MNGMIFSTAAFTAIGFACSYFVVDAAKANLKDQIRVYETEILPVHKKSLSSYNVALAMHEFEQKQIIEQRIRAPYAAVGLLQYPMPKTPPPETPVRPEIDVEAVTRHYLIGAGSGFGVGWLVFMLASLHRKSSD